MFFPKTLIFVLEYYESYVHKMFTTACKSTAEQSEFITPSLCDDRLSHRVTSLLIIFMINAENSRKCSSLFPSVQVEFKPIMVSNVAGVIFSINSNFDN